MTGKTCIEMEEAFLFERSLIICHNKGKTGMFGMEDEYSFWIRFPMNKLKVGLIPIEVFNSEILWQVEDPDPESHHFVVSIPTSTSEEDFTSDTCTLDTTLTLEAKTEDVKKVWLREIRRKTETRFITGHWTPGASQLESGGQSRLDSEV